MNKAYNVGVANGIAEVLVMLEMQDTKDLHDAEDGKGVEELEIFVNAGVGEEVVMGGFMDKVLASTKTGGNYEDSGYVSRPPQWAIGRKVQLDVLADGDARCEDNIIVENGESSEEVIPGFVTIGDSEGLSVCLC
jgi:hypothetical protein